MTKSKKNGGKTGKNKVSFAEAKFDLLGVNQFGQDFYTWLIVEKASDPDYAKGIVYNANRLLIQANVPPPPSD